MNTKDIEVGSITCAYDVFDRYRSNEAARSHFGVHKERPEYFVAESRTTILPRNQFLVLQVESESSSREYFWVKILLLASEEIYWLSV